MRQLTSRKPKDPVPPDVRQQLTDFGSRFVWVVPKLVNMSLPSMERICDGFAHGFGTYDHCVIAKIDSSMKTTIEFGLQFNQGDPFIHLAFRF